MLSVKKEIWLSWHLRYTVDLFISPACTTGKYLQKNCHKSYMENNHRCQIVSHINGKKNMYVVLRPHKNGWAVQAARSLEKGLSLSYICPTNSKAVSQHDLVQVISFNGASGRFSFHFRGFMKNV